MWIVLVAVAAVVAGIVMARVSWRSRADEVHSVSKYRSALDTIEHLADRRPKSNVRVTGQPPGSDVRGRVGDPDAPGGATGPSAPSVPVRGSNEWPDLEAPLVFDEARPMEEPRPRAAEHVSPVFRSDRTRRHALDSMHRGPRRSMLAFAVIAVLAAFGVLAVIGSRHPTHASSTTRPGSATSASHAPPSTNASRHTGTVHRGVPPRTTTPTTAAPVAARSSTPTSAVYDVTTNPYQVTVTASGPCWIDATAMMTGATLWTGTLQPGASQVIQATGPMSLELGSPSAALTVGGAQVAFPSPMHSPFKAVFEPGTTTATTPPTTTPTTATG